jgi:RNA polymerase subunit RPABC4/transcription elongation factor Spt4
MKICDNCQRINLDEAEVCIGCGGDKFTEIIFPFYNDIESYLESE